MASVKHTWKIAQLVPSELRRGIWLYMWSLLEMGIMADDDDDDDDDDDTAAVTEWVPVAEPITCSKVDGQVGDKGTKIGMHAWQGISGVQVSTATSIQECRLLTSDVRVSTATEKTKGKLLVLKDRQKSDKLRFKLRKCSLS
jgi:hypothetical protein